MVCGVKEINKKIQREKKRDERKRKTKLKRLEWE